MGDSTSSSSKSDLLAGTPVSAGLQLPFLLVAATALSLGAYQKEGNISPGAIAWLVVAVVCTLGAFAAAVATKGFLATARVPLGPIVAACVCASFGALLWSPVYGPMKSESAAPIRMLVIVLSSAAVLAGSLCSDRPWLGRLTYPILVLLAGVMGLFTIQMLRMPGIDVLMFQRMSCDALLEGMNPYAMQYPDPYPAASSARFYGPGVSVDGVLQFGFPYMPLTLLMALPGYLLGDVRYAHLAAMLGAALLLRQAMPTRIGTLAAVLLLFMPISPLMLFLGWTESFVVLLLALTVYCHQRRPGLMPFALGLLLATKQYMPALAPLALLMLPRPWTARAIWELAWKAGLAWCVVSLPMILWDVQAFMDSAIWLQFRQPYRTDALSFLVWFSPANPAQWTWLAFAALLAGLGACVVAGWRGRAVSFPLAAAVCLLLFFATNKQAFANYYYLVVGAMLCAAAANSKMDEGRIGVELRSEFRL